MPSCRIHGRERRSPFTTSSDQRFLPTGNRVSGTNNPQKPGTRSGTHAAGHERTDSISSGSIPAASTSPAVPSCRRSSVPCSHGTGSTPSAMLSSLTSKNPVDSVTLAYYQVSTSQTGTLRVSTSHVLAGLREGGPCRSCWLPTLWNSTMLPGGHWASAMLGHG